MPLDIAIRSLSNEKDVTLMAFNPVDDGLGNVVVSPDGQIQFAPDAAHMITDQTGTHGGIQIAPFISAQSVVAFAPGTRSQYLDEYVVGFEHEFGNSGVIFSARYTDRRIKRIVEDMAALSPEAGQTNLSQIYQIGNPSKNLDVFLNPQEITYAGAVAPAACTVAGMTPILNGQATDSNGNPVTLGNGDDHFCIPNAFDGTGLNQIA